LPGQQPSGLPVGSENHQSHRYLLNNHH
jgi:hypothetical protein